MMIAFENTDLLTVAEAATLLKVSIVTVQRWIKQGRLPAYHLGPRRVRVRRADLLTLMSPVSRDRSAGVVQAVPMTNELTLPPLGDAEVADVMEAFRAADAHIEEMRERRGGRPMGSSVPLIREAREKRSNQLLAR